MTQSIFLCEEIKCDIGGNSIHFFFIFYKLKKKKNCFKRAQQVEFILCLYYIILIIKKLKRKNLFWTETNFKLANFMESLRTE